MAFFIINYLLIKPDDFRCRVDYFVKNVKDLDHWKKENWYKDHIDFHKVPFDLQFSFETKMIN